MRISRWLNRLWRNCLLRNATHRVGRRRFHSLPSALLSAGSESLESRLFLSAAAVDGTARDMGWADSPRAIQRAIVHFVSNVDHTLAQSTVETVGDVAIASNDELNLAVGGPAVSWAKQQPAVKVLPQVTVGGTAALTGGTLTIRINAVGTAKKTLDQIQYVGLATLSSNSTSQYVNGQYTLHVPLSDGATVGSVQTFLRTLTFATKGKGLRLATRTVNVTLEAGGHSASILQTVNVSKKVTTPTPGGTETVPFDSLRDAENLQLPNSGYHALATAPDGTVGRILWQAANWVDGELVGTDALYYGELQSDGTWTEESIPLELPVGGSIFRTIEINGDEAQLFFDADSNPHLIMNGGYAQNHVWRDGADWKLEVATYRIAEAASLSSYGSFTAAMGPQGEIHVAFNAYWDDSEASPIVYGTNASGEWQFSVAFDAPALFPYGLPYQQTGTYTRYFQLAVDSQNHAHIVYTPEFQSEPVSGGTRVYSELAYATNRSGEWKTEVVDRPLDGTGDSGLAASIAIDPVTDRPAIASFFVDRVGTGSPSNGRLYFHALQANGSWTHTTVASSADGYTARDGNQGTGFAPLLAFDRAGRANILFCDYASQHFAGFGADEFAGQLRLARLEDNVWRIKTIFRQADPIRNYLIYPTFAIGDNRISYLAIWRRDVLGANSVVIDHSLKLLELNLPLP